jgi:hypothetical protein
METVLAVIHAMAAAKIVLRNPTAKPVPNM